jgi:hypothetical protein
MNSEKYIYKNPQKLVLCYLSIYTITNKYRISSFDSFPAFQFLNFRGNTDFRTYDIFYFA